jgi:hypothetical protein
MASRSDIRTAVLFLALTGLSACSMTPAVTEPAPSDALPASFDAPDPSGVTRIAELAEPWWAAWESPELDTLIDSVVVANLDLEMAAARVLEVQEAYRMSRSGQLPALQASAGGTRQNTPTNLGATGRFASSIPGFPERFDVTTYSASLGLAWELDLWGRARAPGRGRGGGGGGGGAGGGGGGPPPPPDSARCWPPRRTTARCAWGSLLKPWPPGWSGAN